jgi:hypothetical protein
MTVASHANGWYGRHHAARLRQRCFKLPTVTLSRWQSLFKRTIMDEAADYQRFVDAASDECVSPADVGR